MKPELISFDLCPFVQRSVITLLEKRVDFDITYIELADPPAWFLEISPLGKVPALRVGEETLFESAVINEYLDEITPPTLHPSDPLKKAMNKAWIEFASEMIGTQYLYGIAITEEEFSQKEAQQKKLLKHLEAKLGEGPFFNGEKFSLVEAAFAPYFTRAALFECHHNTALYTETPKVAKWADLLIQRDSVKQSVKADFDQKYMQYFADMDTYAAKVFGK
jgi:glutathione S-transferase